jgi:hypothetical protein
MTEAAPINAVMRALADPTAERHDARRHFSTPQGPEAGGPGRRAPRRLGKSITAPSRKAASPLVDWMSRYGVFYAWKGGHEGNVGYGSRLDTVVTFILSKVENGTRLRLVHSGFVLPKNDSAFKNMSEGWKKVVQNIGDIVDGKD